MYNVNFIPENIKERFSGFISTVSQEMGKYANYAVTIISQTPAHMQRSLPVAVGVIGTANALFFMTMQCITNQMNHQVEKRTQSSAMKKIFKHIILNGVIGASTFGFNVWLSKTTQYTLSLQVLIAISTTAVALRTLWNLLKRENPMPIPMPPNPMPPNPMPPNPMPNPMPPDPMPDPTLKVPEAPPFDYKPLAPPHKPLAPPPPQQNFLAQLQAAKLKKITPPPFLSSKSQSQIFSVIPPDWREEIKNGNLTKIENGKVVLATGTPEQQNKFDEDLKKFNGIQLAKVVGMLAQRDGVKKVDPSDDGDDWT